MTGEAVALNILHSNRLKDERSWRRIRILGMSGLLVLDACSADSNTKATATTAAVSLSSEAQVTTINRRPVTSGNTENTQVISTAKEGSEIPVLVFDDLVGGNAVINVYPGVTQAAADKVYNGTYFGGDKVVAECKTIGRKVMPLIVRKEFEPTFNQWIRITGSPGEVQYATASYISNPVELLAKLPICGS